RKERWLASPLTGTGTAFGPSCYQHTRLRLSTLELNSRYQFTSTSSASGGKLRIQSLVASDIVCGGKNCLDMDAISC
ncbi:unnamed protein product, partial [Linum tenue]